MKAKLNAKFYITSVLLLGLVVFIWYAIYFLNANEILMEDHTPMDPGVKTLFTVALGAVALSWTMSLLTLVRQIIAGVAFRMDEEGIHTTATIVRFFAFIFIVPVKTIPYDAIRRIYKENGILSATIKKSKVQIFPVLKPFLGKEYHFFFGFTREKQDEIGQTIHQFMTNHEN